MNSVARMKGIICMICVKICCCHDTPTIQITSLYGAKDILIQCIRLSDLLWQWFYRNMEDMKGSEYLFPDKYVREND